MFGFRSSEVQSIGEVSYPVRQITGDQVTYELPNGQAKFHWNDGSSIKFTDEPSKITFRVYPQVRFAACGAPPTVEILKEILINRREISH